MNEVWKCLLDYIWGNLWTYVHQMLISKKKLGNPRLPQCMSGPNKVLEGQDVRYRRTVSSVTLCMCLDWEACFVKLG